MPDIHLMSILGWMLFGLVVGVIARFLIPGRDPMGWIATMVLGIIGSFVGGFLAYLLKLGTDPYSPAGWIMSILGAIVALLLYYWLGGTRRA